MKIYISKKADIKINMRIDYWTFCKIMNIIIASLASVALILALTCIILNSQFKRYTVEAGDELTAYEICGEGAYFGEDYDPECVNRAGAYYFTVHTPKRDRTVRLKVVDTKAPEVTVKDVLFAVNGEMPSPLDFIDTVFEPNGLSGEFVSEIPDTKSLGDYEMKVRYLDASGNKTKTFTVKMTQIYDSVPPTLEVDPVITAYLGESVEYLPHVYMSDNCVGELTINADESGLDLENTGEYTVYLTALDGVGNRSERAEVTVKVVERYTDALFEELIADVAREVSAKNASAEIICRRIYDYTRAAVDYVGSSQKGDVKRAAYYGIVSGEGDCYTYFSLAKVLLDYFEIENLDIERARGYTVDTHFWSMVNIGSADEPKWYHFDCTELRRDEYDHSGCLLTDKQIDAYTKIRKDFYKYNKNEYPASSEEIITRTPELEKFY